MSTENDRSDLTGSEQPSVTDPSRRSFAKAGASLAPMIMLLANRPAWATNTCTQSGFASYQANSNLSHTANIKNVNWRKPNDNTSTKLGWYQTTSWPAGFARASRNGSSTDYYSSLWTGAKTLAQVQTFETQVGKKLLLSTLFPTVCAGSAETLLDALVVVDLNSYRVASAFNNLVAPMPTYFLTATASLYDYQTFYSTCT